LRIAYQKTHFAVDWVLALVEADGRLLAFAPVEVQTIDTTGSYRRQSWTMQRDCGSTRIASYVEPPEKASNFNWENVNKRILPQLITKGHIVRREPLCTKGLYFVCPTPVFNKIRGRLAGEMLSYAPQPGAITFHHYGLDIASRSDPKPLILAGESTTTIDQLAIALTAPRELPPSGQYGQVIQRAIQDRLQGGL
jgi:hypothetical protein